MRKGRALKLFEALEEFNVAVEGDPEAGDKVDREGYEEPTFDVRLDASSTETHDGIVERCWRIRVTWTRTQFVEDANAELKTVIELASSMGVEVRLDNSGLELV